MWWLVIVWCFVEALWQGVLYYLFFEERLYALEEVEVFWCYKSDGYAVAVGTCCASDAVYVVFHVVWDVIVYDHAYIVDVDATCYDVSGYEHVYLSAFEAEHHIVTLCLCEVGVHLSAVDVLFFQ